MIKGKDKKVLLLEIVRFGVVGLLATLIHYGVYWLLQRWINLNIAYAVGYGLSFMANFFLTAYFTFNTNPSLKRGFGFGGSHIVNLILQMGLLNWFIFLGISRTLAPIPVYMITIPVNFLLVRFVFKYKSHHHEESNNTNSMLQ